MERVNVDAMSVDLELKPMQHNLLVSIVLLVISHLDLDNVNHVLLDRLLVLLEQLNVKIVLADMKHLLTEQRAFLVQLVNFHQMEEIVHFVQLVPSVLELHHVNVLNVDLELKPMPH